MFYGFLKQVLVRQLLKDVITRYMKTATCQFLRDFRRGYKPKKTAEHRKRELQRKQAATERNDHPKFATMLEDRSTGKQHSHQRVCVFVEKHGIAGVKRVYNKVQLVKLCKAYGIRVRSTYNKQDLAKELVELLKNNSSLTAMPHPHHLHNLSAQADVVDGRVMLRITRSN